MCQPRPDPNFSPPSNQCPRPLPADSIDGALDPDLFCREPVIEHFPDKTAGAPINDDVYEPPDLKTYLRSCGPFASRGNFEDAELLMSTGLNNKGRDRHLSSRRVSKNSMIYFEFFLSIVPFSIVAERPGVTITSCSEILTSSRQGQSGRFKRSKLLRERTCGTLLCLNGMLLRWFES